MKEHVQDKYGPRGNRVHELLEKGAYKLNEIPAKMYETPARDI